MTDFATTFKVYDFFMMKRDFDSMTAELMLVFTAGFTMVANAINFVAYALAINLKVQEKLY